MAPILPKHRRRAQRPDPISNSYVEDGGRRYRICRHGSRVILVGLRSELPHGIGRERLLKVDSRRAQQLIALADKER